MKIAVYLTFKPGAKQLRLTRVLSNLNVHSSVYGRTMVSLERLKIHYRSSCQKEVFLSQDVTLSLVVLSAGCMVLLKNC